MNGPGGGEVVLLDRSHHLRHLLGNFIRHDRDDPASANGHDGERQRIVSGRTRKSEGTALQISHTCVTLPDASLTPTTFGIAASRTSVLTSMLTPVRPGT